MSTTTTALCIFLPFCHFGHFATFAVLWFCVLCRFVLLYVSLFGVYSFVIMLLEVGVNVGAESDNG